MNTNINRRSHEDKNLKIKIEAVVSEVDFESQLNPEFAGEEGQGVDSEGNLEYLDHPVIVVDYLITSPKTEKPHELKGVYHRELDVFSDEPMSNDCMQRCAVSEDNGDLANLEIYSDNYEYFKDLQGEDETSFPFYSRDELYFIASFIEKYESDLKESDFEKELSYDDVLDCFIFGFKYHRERFQIDEEDVKFYASILLKKRKSKKEKELMSHLQICNSELYNGLVAITEEKQA